MISDSEAKVPDPCRSGKLVSNTSSYDVVHIRLVSVAGGLHGGGQQRGAGHLLHLIIHKVFIIN